MLVQRVGSGLASRSMDLLGVTPVADLGARFAVGTSKIFGASEDGKAINVVDIGTDRLQILPTNFGRRLAALGERAAWVEATKLVRYTPNEYLPKNVWHMGHGGLSRKQVFWSSDALAGDHDAIVERRLRSGRHALCDRRAIRWSLQLPNADATALREPGFATRTG
jgi:hypothetical protein